MTLKQMQYFLSVCQTQNLTKSAEELYVSQPTLSVAMKELEREVGVPLFQKNGTHLFLTNAGATLEEEVSSVMEQYHKMELLIRSGNLNRNYIRFGFSTIVGNIAAPEICRRFMLDNPDLRINLTEDYGNNLLWKLENNQLDVVLTGSNYSKKPKWEGKFQFRTLNHNSFMVYCVGSQSPLAKKETITMEEIAKHPIIMPNSTFPVAESLEKYFLSKGYPLNIVLRTSQLFTIERFTATGDVGGFLPEGACIGNTAIVPIECPELRDSQPNSVGIYWHKKSQILYPLKRFLKSAFQETE